MSIQALPASTLQLLRCSMNLTSPSDLVKEFIDNSIDARATAIEVTVSSNTMDRIAVKDNGTGIDMDDFRALARRAHTSKLRAFEELTSIGGKSLGFRGEALASANSVAKIVIVTKKPRDPIAWRVELVHGVGGVQTKHPVSATVGTTVAATKLFENMPPRKTYLLKEKSKTMAKIQDTLRAYALARPHIKWSLKVVGDAKPMWSYSPTTAASGREAILQLFGANLLDKCIEISERLPKTSTSGPGAGHSSKPADWIFSGYVSVQHSPGASRQAVFISIDGRPMSSSWHISKGIANGVKSYITNTKKHSDTSSSTGHLFVQLNIQCPPMSYDPNITAQKDEVLLSDEKSLLEKLEVIFKRTLSQDLQCSRTVAPLASSECSTGSTLRKLQSPHRSGRGAKDDTFYQSHDKSNSGADRRNVGNHGDHHGDERTATEQPKIRTVVKTTFAVNMSKREDDESDDENGQNVIEVEIPRRASPVPVDDGVRKGNIRHYFHPVPRQDFDIACDDTATNAGSLEAQDTRHMANSPSPDRIPLKCLTASDLNGMQDEAESSSEQPRFNPAIPRIATSARNVDSAMESPPLQRATYVARHGSGSAGLDGSFHRPRAPIGRIQEAPESAISVPSFIRQYPTVLTPPPSDPRQRMNHDGPPHRPRLPWLDASPTPADTANRPSNRRTGLPDASSSRRQGGRSSRHIPSYRDTFAVPWGRAQGGGLSLGGTRDQGVTHVAKKACRGLADMNHTGLFSRPAEKSLIPFQPLPRLEASQGSPLPTTRGTPPEIQGVPLGCSHASQMDLARTPAYTHAFGAAPGSIMIRGPKDVKPKGTEEHRHMVDVDWATELPIADWSCSSQQGKFDVPNSAERYGRQGLGLSERFAFQPEGVASTQHLRTTIHAGHGEIERLVGQHEKVGQYELPGDIAVTLLTANLGSVQSVQRRLRWCVDSWLQQNKMRGHVDYTM